MKVNKLEKSYKRKIYIFALLASIFSLIYCIAIGSNKQISFCDEVYTYESANLPGKSNPFFSENTWITGKDIQWYLSAEGHNPHFIEINEHLWPDHVPLYFWCIRIMSILFYDSCSPMIGIWVNALIFAAFSFWFTVRIYQLLHKWLASEKITRKSAGIVSVMVMFIIIAIFFWMQETVFQIVFTIRPYILLLSLSVMLLYEYTLFILRSYSDTSGNQKQIVKDIIKLTFLVVAGLLSHYHFWVFFSLCGLLTWIICFCKKQWKKARFLVLHAICSIGITTCLFPQWIHNLFMGKGNISQRSILTTEFWLPGFVKALEKMTVNIFPWANIPWYLIWGINIVIFYCAFSLMRKRKHYDYMKAVIWMCIEVWSYTILVSIATTYLNEGRYFWLSQAIYALIIYVLLGYIIINGIICLGQKNEDISGRNESILLKIQTYISTAFLLLLVVFSFIKIQSENNLYVLKGTGNEELMQAVSGIPWIVYTDGIDWKDYCSAYDFMYAENICFVPNSAGQTNKGLHLPNDKEAIIFVKEETYEDAVTYFKNSLGKEVKSTKIGDSMYLDVYHFEFLSEVMN